QQPGLVGRTRTQLDQRAGPGGGGDLLRHRGQDGPLDARRVVLIQLGDLLEQLTAVLVIQPLGGQRLGRGQQAGPGVRAPGPVLVAVRGLAFDVQCGHQAGILPPSGPAAGGGGLTGRGRTSTPSRVAVSTLLPGTSVQPGSSSPGSDATTTPAPPGAAA